MISGNDGDMEKARVTPLTDGGVVNHGQSLGAALRLLFDRLSPTRRRQFYLLLVLMFLGAIAELVALGAVIPFLTLLADPDRVTKIGVVASAFAALGARSNNELLVAATVIFAIAALVAGAIRLLLAWTTQSFAFRLGHELGVDIHRRMLMQPYAYHVAHNSSHMISVLEKLHLVVINLLLPAMQAVAAAVIAVFIIAALIYIDPLVAAISAGAFAGVYIVVSVFTQRRLIRNSDFINAAYTQRVKAVQESLGGIRDIIIDKSQPVYLERFERIDARFRHAQAINSFIGVAPRFLIEAAGMVLIAGLAFMLARQEGGLASGIPVLGALALGAQRLLPLLQQIYYGWAQIGGARGVLYDVVEQLKLPAPDKKGAVIESLPFKQEIRFENVSFSYPSRNEAVLHEVALSIPKGSKVAFIGKTGSGKSTLIDLLMGLLEPTKGRITVDGVALTGAARERWQSEIAHVPQSIFLADASIEQNIAFGVANKEIDRERVVAAARQAQLHDFILDLPEGYDTATGERGVRLSGGQRQRLGIARALYKSASVLILDEATSALDDETEVAVMQALKGLDEKLTVVMIAHRLSTIADCDHIVRIDKGRVIAAGNYDKVVSSLRSENV